MGDTERAERVDDRVRDSGECPTLPALAGTLDTQRVGLVRPLNARMAVPASAIKI
jgi:hypothetical protein